MLFGLSLFLRGTPFIYQGDELGMVDAGFTSVDQLEDIESKDAFLDLEKRGMSEKKALRCILRVSRDNARIPMQWEEGANRGFSSAPAWIRSPREDPDHSAAAESKKTDSVLSFYKECLSFRAGKNRNVFLHGKIPQSFVEARESFFHFDLRDDDFLVFQGKGVDKRVDVALPLDPLG